ncbi:hypothetical protein TNCV_3607151 [Trichonephila clavipes]|nr:hypothetical protein TNCV_3607151 [Trichonephila clavipes]
MIVQFRNEKVSNHGSIPITIDCNVVAFIVFEEGFHQPIKRTKQLHNAHGIDSVECRINASGDARRNTSRYRVNKSADGVLRDGSPHFLSTICQSWSFVRGRGRVCKRRPMTSHTCSIGERSG